MVESIVNFDHLAKNAMLRRRPELFDEWAFEKNDELGLDVYKITYGSGKEAWWKCCDGISLYKRRVADKFRSQSSCLHCSSKFPNDNNNLLNCFPELAREWHPIKNKPYTPKDVHSYSNKDFYWLCYCGHEWKARVSSRSASDNGCPYCAGRIINEDNNFGVKNPELLKTWSFELNDISPYEIGSGSREKVWWTCESCESDYKCSVGNRTHGKACSFCHGRRVNKTNSLSERKPNVAEEWDFELNDLTPDKVTAYSHLSVWWLCREHGHSYKATISNRSAGKGCPYCSGQRILAGFNDLCTTHSYLVELLVDHNDGYLYTSGSNKKLGWNCSKCLSYAGEKRISKVCVRGVICNSCSESLSYGERFVYNLLSHHEMVFEHEKEFIWSEKKRYDFYLPELNCIIEVHGLQHYQGAGFSGLGGRTVEEEKENDRFKESLAIENRIDRYIVIDARESSFDFIVNSVEESQLHKKLGIVEKTDWGYLSTKCVERVLIS